MKKYLQKYFAVIFFLITISYSYSQNFQFQPLKNLYGGTVNTIANVGTVTLYAGTNTGIYCSSDHGKHWEKELDGLTVNKIVAYSKDQIYAGTSNGLYERRADHWNKITGFTDGVVNDIGILSSGVIFVSVQGEGLFKGKAGDTIFSEVTTLGYSSYKYHITCNNETVFVDRMMSNDGGETWKKLENGWPEFRSLNTIGANMTDSLIIAGSDNGVFRYNLKDQTWENLNLYQYCLDITIDDGGHIFLGSAGGVYYSSNRGDNWQQINTGLLGAYVPAVCIMADSVYAATLYGINACEIGQTSWGTANTGITEVPVYAILPLENYLLISSGRGVLRTKDDGTNWEKTHRMDVGIIFNDHVNKFLQTPKGKVYAGTYTGLYFSNDRGHSWFLCPGNSGQQIYDFVFDKKGNLLKATADGVYESDDDGLTWTKLNKDKGLGTVTCITTDDNDNIYAGTNQGIYASKDEGKTWTDIAQDSLKNFRFVRLIQHGNYVYAATSNGIFTYDIFYNNWSESQTGMGEKYVTDLIRTTDNKYYASTSSGIYFSSDSCTSWQAIDMGTANKNVQCMAFDSKGNFYYGTTNNGVYTSKTSLTGISEPTKQKDFALSNAPNPFQNRTTITYVLPKSKTKIPVTLTVLNMLGQKVAVLYHGEQFPGEHQITFTPKNQKPGIYFIALQIGEKQILKKIILTQ